MDVHCTTCREPWDTDHLLHDLIWETGMSKDEIKEWQRLPTSEKLTNGIRVEFKSLGFVFGQSLLNVTRCSCCSRSAVPDREWEARKAELELLLGDDHDGLASEFEDQGL